MTRIGFSFFDGVDSTLLTLVETSDIGVEVDLYEDMAGSVFVSILYWMWWLPTHEGEELDLRSRSQSQNQCRSRSVELCASSFVNRSSDQRHYL
jgi:hypothetical protein